MNSFGKTHYLYLVLISFLVVRFTLIPSFLPTLLPTKKFFFYISFSLVFFLSIFLFLHALMTHFNSPPHTKSYPHFNSYSHTNSCSLFNCVFPSFHWSPSHSPFFSYTLFKLASKSRSREILTLRSVKSRVNSDPPFEKVRTYWATHKDNRM